MTRVPATRRQLLAVCGALAGGASAGCLGDEPRTTEESMGSTHKSASTTETPTPTPTPPETSTSTPPPAHEGYEFVEVAVETPGGEELGVVIAAVADTTQRRYLGLSDTEILPEDRGMLFVFDDADERTFVMREMDFGIDIVFVDSDKTITTIHHAPAPGPDQDGSNQRYPAYGQYVLEVSYEWTVDHGVAEGDVIQFDLREGADQ